MSNLETYDATTARDNFSDVIEKAVHRGPVLIKRNNKIKAAVISKDLFDFYTQLEAIMESEQAQAALSEYEAKGGTPLSKLKQELGM